MMAARSMSFQLKLEKHKSSTDTARIKVCWHSPSVFQIQFEWQRHARDRHKSGTQWTSWDHPVEPCMTMIINVWMATMERPLWSGYRKLFIGSFT